MSEEKKRPGVGFGVMVLKDDKVLLGKRHEDPEKASSLMHGEGTWTMPGGKLDFQEEIEDGAAREITEETSLEIRKEDLKFASLTNDIVHDNHFVTIGFLCEKFEGEPKVMEPDEITEWQWFPLDKLPKKVFFPSQEIIDHYNSGKIYG